MICPGPKRPPVMEPVLERTAAPLDREGREDRGPPEDAGRRGVTGSIVSPASLGLSSTSVAAEAQSAGEPQCEQNRAVLDISAPQEEQNIAARFYTSH